MDYLCGRLVYYDEIPNDFASSDNERIECAHNYTHTHTLFTIAHACPCYLAGT